MNGQMSHLNRYVMNFQFVSASSGYLWDIEDVPIQEAEEEFEEWIRMGFKIEVCMDNDKLQKVQEQGYFTNLQITTSKKSIVAIPPCEIIVLSTFKDRRGVDRIFCKKVRNVKKITRHIFDLASEEYEDFPVDNVDKILMDKLLEIASKFTDLDKKERVKKAITCIFGFDNLVA